MSSNAVTWCCILVLTIQLTQSAIFKISRATESETHIRIKLMQENVEENAKQAEEVLKIYEAYGQATLQMHSPAILNEVNNSTSTAVKIVEQLQSELEKVGNHHVVELCITYDKLYKIKNGIITKIKNQVKTSATQISRAYSEAINEINKIKSNSSILLILPDECKVLELPDKCYDEVLFKANGVEDELISGILKQHKEATSSIDRILSFSNQSTSLYIQRVNNDLKMEVNRIYICIEEEVGVNPINRSYLFLDLLRRENEI